MLKVMLSFLIFLILFSFRIPGFYNSVIFSCFVMFFLSFFYKTNLYISLKNIAIKKIFLIYLLFISYVIIYSVSSGVMDFSRLNSTVSNIVSLISIILLSNFVYHYNSKVNINDYNSRFNNISELIYYVFIAQSMIILLAMLSPSFREVVQLFQSPADSLRAEKYDGVRGLALSGGQFFPLSALFACAQLIIFRFLLKGKKSTIFDWLMFSLIVLMGLTSGRTSIVGFSFCLLYFAFNFSFNFNLIVQFLKKLFLFIILIVIAFSLLNIFIPSLSAISEKFINFAFEFFINYQNTGTVSTQSTDILSNMYWSISLDTLFLGEGKYTNDDGTAYMHTDAGYMRNVLFFGLIGTSIVLYSQVIYSKLLYFVTGRDFIFSMLTLILMLSLHYKGEIILHLVSVQSLFFLLLIAPYQVNIAKE